MNKLPQYSLGMKNQDRNDPSKNIKKRMRKRILLRTIKVIGILVLEWVFRLWLDLETWVDLVLTCLTMEIIMEINSDGLDLCFV